MTGCRRMLVHHRARPIRRGRTRLTCNSFASPSGFAATIAGILSISQSGGCQADALTIVHPLRCGLVDPGFARQRDWWAERRPIRDLDDARHGSYQLLVPGRLPLAI